MATELDRGDMQGLLISSFVHLHCAAYRMLRVTDATKARRWLATAAADVTTAKRREDISSLNIALTAEGLKALGVPDDTLRTFPPAFVEGMVSPRRSRVLGDAGDNNPTQWDWGRPGLPVHVLLLSYGREEGDLVRGEQRWMPPADSGLAELTTLEAGRQPDQREHFGFMDGVGQPAFTGSGRVKAQEQRTGHVTELAPGEFVLGYVN